MSCRSVQTRTSCRCGLRDALNEARLEIEALQDALARLLDARAEIKTLREQVAELQAKVNEQKQFPLPDPEHWDWDQDARTFYERGRNDANEKGEDDEEKCEPLGGG